MINSLTMLPVVMESQLQVIDQMKMMTMEGAYERRRAADELHLPRRAVWGFRLEML